MLCHWCPEQSNAKTISKMEGPSLRTMERSWPLINQRRRYACVFPQDADSLIWVSAQTGFAMPQLPDTRIPTTAIPKEEAFPSSASTSMGNDADPGQLTLEIPDEWAEPPTGQMSKTSDTGYVHLIFCLEESIRTPSSVNPTRPPYPPGGQIKALCRQAQGIVSYRDLQPLPKRCLLPCFLCSLAR